MTRALTRWTHALIAAVAVSLASNGMAQPECTGSWAPGPLNFENIDGAVSAMWVYDPPGSDPQMLFAGGTFRHIGGLTVQHIAAWDGTLWRAVGNGLPGPVRSLIVYNNMLVAGGDFPGHVAFWNGNDWAYPSGGPIYGDYSSPFTEPITVYALAVHQGQLWAGGRFSEADGQEVSNVTVLDPLNNRWDPIPGIGGEVNALQVFDPDGAGSAPADLYAGSRWLSASSTTLRRWSGSSWASIQSGLHDSPNGSVYALTVTNQGLIVGGSFSYIDVPGDNISARCIAGYNGSSWFTLGSGCGDNYINEGVTSLRAYGSDLIVGGKFDDADGNLVNNLVRWNGASYSQVGGGLNDNGLNSPVSEMRIFNGELYIGGGFVVTDGSGVQSRNLVRLTGSGLVGMPPQWAQVLAAAPWAGRIVFGGYFAHSDGTNPSSNTRNLMSWNGTSTAGFGAGVNASVRAIRALPSTGEIAHMAVGGDFTTAGVTAVNRVAKWSQSDTNPFQTGWSPMGSGFNSSVLALETGYGGVLIAGGLFTASGAQPLGYMARWSTSLNQWLPFATAGGSDMNGTVRAIKVYSVSPANPLANVVTVAGGDFTTANGPPRLRIAQWIDNPMSGSTPWAAMGAGFNNTVHAIERHNISGIGNHIYAGGAFTADGNNIAAFNRIARWNGTAWFTVGNGTGFNGPVYALRSLGGYLYAAGAFTSVDGVVAERIARFGGSPLAWSEVGGGLDAAAQVLAIFQTELMVGGHFTQVGSIATGATARFLAGAPWFVQQPAPDTADCGSSGSFSVGVADGYDDATYQWRKDDVPLVDGLTSTGSYISGANAGSLTVGLCSAADEGIYDCVVATICGSATSADAALTVEDCCPADLNNDNVVSVGDLLALISAWGACADPNNCPADLNNDNIVSVGDLLALISAWGPC